MLQVDGNLGRLSNLKSLLAGLLVFIKKKGWALVTEGFDLKTICLSKFGEALDVWKWMCGGTVGG